jgi:uncharacterized protein (DUF2062 family)
MFASPPPPFRPVVLAPTYNNAGTLADVLDRIGRLDLPILVVNDGSTDTTVEILQRWGGTGTDENRIVLTHPHNRGKAAALRSGFARAAALGFTHAITIDTDGQLDPAEIPQFLRCAKRNPAALVLGARDESAADYPGKSRLGRRVSNRLVYWQSGVRVADSQCGFRVYPLAFTTAVRCFASRYGFETEILTRAAWAGIPIEQVPVRCLYELPQGRVSHFRPWRDSFAAVGMHTRLLLRSVRPWPVRRWGDAPTGTLGRRMIRWMSPARAWREVRHDPAERPRFAAAFAVGVFIANLPLYGFQTLLSLFAARHLRLNPLAAVAGSHVSTPPVGPLLIALAIAAGHALLHGSLPSWQYYRDPSSLGAVLIEWLLGSLVCGAALASVSFLITNWLLARLPRAPADTPATPAAHPAAPAPAPDPAAAQSAA